MTAATVAVMGSANARDGADDDRAARDQRAAEATIFKPDAAADAVAAAAAQQQQYVLSRSLQQPAAAWHQGLTQATWQQDPTGQAGHMTHSTPPPGAGAQEHMHGGPSAVAGCEGVGEAAAAPLPEAVPTPKTDPLELSLLASYLQVVRATQGDAAAAHAMAASGLPAAAGGCGAVEGSGLPNSSGTHGTVMSWPPLSKGTSAGAANGNGQPEGSSSQVAAAAAAPTSALAALDAVAGGTSAAGGGTGLGGSALGAPQTPSAPGLGVDSLLGFIKQYKLAGLPTGPGGALARRSSSGSSISSASAAGSAAGSASGPSAAAGPASRGKCWIQPSGPRRPGEGVEDEEQGILSAEETSSAGEVMLRITLLAAGFVIGPSGSSVREIVRTSGADINSWTEPAGSHRGRRPARIFVIKGDHHCVAQAIFIISAAVDRYKELCEGRYSGQSVPRAQNVLGVAFSYQPPPKSIVPCAASLKELYGPVHTAVQSRGLGSPGYGTRRGGGRAAAAAAAAAAHAYDSNSWAAMMAAAAAAQMGVHPLAALAAAGGAAGGYTSPYGGYAGTYGSTPGLGVAASSSTGGGLGGHFLGGILDPYGGYGLGTVLGAPGLLSITDGGLLSGATPATPGLFGAMPAGLATHALNGGPSAAGGAGSSSGAEHAMTAAASADGAATAASAAGTQVLPPQWGTLVTGGPTGVLDPATIAALMAAGGGTTLWAPQPPAQGGALDPAAAAAGTMDPLLAAAMAAGLRVHHGTCTPPPQVNSPALGSEQGTLGSTSAADASSSSRGAADAAVTAPPPGQVVSAAAATSPHHLAKEAAAGGGGGVSIYAGGGGVQQLQSGGAGSAAVPQPAEAAASTPTPTPAALAASVPTADADGVHGTDGALQGAAGHATHGHQQAADGGAPTLTTAAHAPGSEAPVPAGASQPAVQTAASDASAAPPRAPQGGTLHPGWGPSASPCCYTGGPAGAGTAFFPGSHPLPPLMIATPAAAAAAAAAAHHSDAAAAEPGGARSPSAAGPLPYPPPASPGGPPLLGPFGPLFHPISPGAAAYLSYSGFPPVPASPVRILRDRSGAAVPYMEVGGTVYFAPASPLPLVGNGGGRGSSSSGGGASGGGSGVRGSGSGGSRLAAGATATAAADSGAAVPDGDQGAAVVQQDTSASNAATLVGAAANECEGEQQQAQQEPQQQQTSAPTMSSTPPAEEGAFSSTPCSTPPLPLMAPAPLPPPPQPSAAPVSAATAAATSASAAPHNSAASHAQPGSGAPPSTRLGGAAGAALQLLQDNPYLVQEAIGRGRGVGAAGMTAGKTAGMTAGKTAGKTAGMGDAPPRPAATDVVNNHQHQQHQPRQHPCGILGGMDSVSQGSHPPPYLMQQAGQAATRQAQVGAAAPRLIHEAPAACAGAQRSEPGGSALASQHCTGGDSSEPRGAAPSLARHGSSDAGSDADSRDTTTAGWTAAAHSALAATPEERRRSSSAGAAQRAGAARCTAALGGRSPSMTHLERQLDPISETDQGEGQEGQEGEGPVGEGEGSTAAHGSCPHVPPLLPTAHTMQLNAQQDPIVSPGRITLASKVKAARLHNSAQRSAAAAAGGGGAAGGGDDNRPSASGERGRV